jgi:hypothetical protein
MNRRENLQELDVASVEWELEEEGAEGKSAAGTAVTSPLVSYITGARPEKQCRRENKSVVPGSDTSILNGQSLYGRRIGHRCDIPTL